MNSPNLCYDDLAHNPVFEDLEREQLHWLLRHSTCCELQPGDSLWTDGAPADAMFVVLSGTVQMFFDMAGQTLRVDASVRNGVIGMLPYSRMTEFKGKTYAAEPARVLRIAKDDFPDMLREIPELGYRLVALLSDRVRDSTRVADQRAKMMALGKLSAGLAHELNNPAAAVQRAADELSKRLHHSNRLMSRIALHGLDPQLLQSSVALRELGEPGRGAELSVLDRGDREEALGDWLDELDIEDAWGLAEAFVDAGIDLESLQEACRPVPEKARKDVLAWVGNGLAARQLLSQVNAASNHISELVASIKTYSHMDRTPDKAPADIHRGLESTLSLMKHKLTQRDIQLERHFDTTMPTVPMQVSDLNQVWTNLVDNAIDAMEPGGRLQLCTEHDGISAYVRVIDNGSGIDPEAQEQIFDPFFTTKGVGEGTGLGLDISQHIVQQHDGEITVDSKPGRTEFVVRLPLEAIEPGDLATQPSAT